MNCLVISPSNAAATHAPIDSSYQDKVLFSVYVKAKSNVQKTKNHLNLSFRPQQNFLCVLLLLIILSSEF